jgi:catechol 2,3-dioxygenase-like lactoylglutathione lyase family enzyme
MRLGVCMIFFGMASTLMGASLDLEGVAHIAFRVADVAVSRDFYEKLGFDQAFEFNDAAGTTTSYLKVNDRQFIELYRRRPGEPLGLMHLCFDVADLEALYAAYRDRGLQPSAPVKARAGNLLFNLRDPEAQVLEYTQYLPGSLHWNARGTPSPDRRISERMVEFAVAVKDVAAEQAFYGGKLDLADRESHRLRLPGVSGQEIVLEPLTPEWKPRIRFSVADVSRAADELRSRGLRPRIVAGAVIVLDPDGAELVFAPKPSD